MFLMSEVPLYERGTPVQAHGTPKGASARNTIGWCRGTSLIRNSAPLGPYRRFSGGTEEDMRRRAVKVLIAPLSFVRI